MGTAGFWGSGNLQIDTTYTPGITKTIVVNATADVPLLFMQIFGQRKATVSASATATRTDSRIMLVIDRSTSMTQVQPDGNTAFEDAIAQAIAFVDSWNSGTDEVGLILFDGTAVVAYPVYAKGTYSTTPAAAGGPDSDFNTIVGPATVGPVVSQLNAAKVSASTGSTNTSEALWLAYVELQKAHLRDIAGGTTDTRINAIVLLTDGLPQAVTIWPNNATSYNTYYSMVTSGSNCKNLYNATTNPTPNPILGFMSISRGTIGKTMFTGSGSQPDDYLYQTYSTDKKFLTSDWLALPSNVSTDAGAGSTMRLETLNDSACTKLFNSSGKDLREIPDYDAYGSTMSGTAYKASKFVNASGPVSNANNPYLGPGAPDLTQSVVYGQIPGTSYYSGLYWAEAQWNAADSAGSRVRTDWNLPNRPGDTKLPIYIYAIGYLGNGGCDQGLLARIANDPILSNVYDTSSAPGKYYPASDEAALRNAFETITATILRLAR